MSATAICSPDLEHQLPLPVQRVVRRPERIALIINIRSFGGCAIKLDDLKFFAGSELFIAAVSNVVSPDIKTRELLTDLVKGVAKFLRVKVFALLENTTLAMIAGLNEAQGFASR